MALNNVAPLSNRLKTAACVFATSTILKNAHQPKKALKRLRTIAHILILELQRKPPQHILFESVQQDFLFYQRVSAQQPKDKNKIYSLHEPDVYVIAKGKDHKRYEYGNKVSIVSTKDTNIIVGVAR